MASIKSIGPPTLLAFRGYVPMGSPNGDPPAIVTEFMPKGSLQGMLEQERDRSAPAIWDATHKHIALYGTAVGMLILHHNRVIHRDLKPDNVLLDANFEPKVADFGQSKFVAPGGSTSHSLHAGTQYYQAPEVIDSLTYSWAADVYAFGVLAYAVITAREPYDGLGLAWLDISDAIVDGGLRPTFPSNIDPRWQDLISRCWDQSPVVRPNFELIVRLMGDPDFIGSRVDLQKFRAYQRKVVPDGLQ